MKKTTKNKLTIKEICMIAMLAAIICVLSLIAIPTPWGVPFTLQTFAVALSGYVLGKKYGTIATILYVILGLIGLPVYAGGKAGPGVLFGPTGGYLFGFIFMAFFCGFAFYIIKLVGKKYADNKSAYQLVKYIVGIVFGVIGLACCHILGTIVFSAVTDRTFAEGFLLASAPYILKDVLSVIGALIVSEIIGLALRKANLSIER